MSWAGITPVKTVFRRLGSVRVRAVRESATTKAVRYPSAGCASTVNVSPACSDCSDSVMTPDSLSSAVRE